MLRQWAKNVLLTEMIAFFPYVTETPTRNWS
jgi:hypothetical protein